MNISSFKVVLPNSDESNFNAHFSPISPKEGFNKKTYVDLLSPISRSILFDCFAQEDQSTRLPINKNVIVQISTEENTPVCSSEEMNERGFLETPSSSSHAYSPFDIDSCKARREARMIKMRERRKRKIGDTDINRNESKDSLMDKISLPSTEKTIPLTKREKQEVRKIRNRESATRFREKKIEYENSLKETIKNLEDQVANLQSKISMYQVEEQNLIGICNSVVAYMNPLQFNSFDLAAPPITNLRNMQEAVACINNTIVPACIKSFSQP